MSETKKQIESELCTQCGLLRANKTHPKKLCIYCVLNITSREKLETGEGAEAPGIGDS